MDISIIIVSYNVEDIIKLCLDSLLLATEEVDVEIIIVDNASIDCTVEVLQENYKEVHLIENHENLGFARACHQGADVASGDTLLFLNPDVLISKDYLRYVISLMANDKGIGTITPLLLDGSGRVLRETARKTPSSMASIKHLLGLSSKDYYEDLKSEVCRNAQVVSGACLAINRDTWQSTGGFDTRYFMYAEDVDLSYQITQLGLKNIVTLDHPVIHLKGESTSKTSWSYNRSFYKSMYLFASKYKGDLYTSVEVFVISVVTIIASVGSLLINLVKSVITPLRDLTLFVMLLFAIQQIWAYVEFQNTAYYNSNQTIVNYLLYGALWALGIFLKSGYTNEKRNDKSVLQGYLIGWLLSVGCYAFLPEELRSSRMVLIIAGGLSFFFLLFRTIYNRSKSSSTIAVLGRNLEDNQIEIRRLHHHAVQLDFIDLSNLNEIKEKKISSVVVDIDLHKEELPSIIESIGGQKPVSYYSKNRQLLVHGHDAKANSIIANELSFYNLSKSEYKLQKRLFDVVSTTLLSPLVIIANINNIRKVLRALVETLIGKKSVIGYQTVKGTSLPKIKPSVYYIGQSSIDVSSEERIRSYAMHYSIFDDVFYLVTNIVAVIGAYGK